MDFALGTAFLQVGPTLLSFHNLFKKVHIGTIYSKQELLVDILIFNTQQKYFLYIDIKHKNVLNFFIIYSSICGLLN